MIGRLVAWAALACALTAGPTQAAAPDLAKMTGGELAAFSHAFPKGGELHNHLGGAIFAETQLGWAAQDGACIDVAALALAATCPPGGRGRPAASLGPDEPLRSAMIDSLSVRHPEFAGRLGHDQFFSAFGRMYRTGRDGDMLAEAMAGLARQNTFYLEVMVTPDVPALRDVVAKVAWRDELPAMRQALVAAGLEAQIPVATAALDAQEARARALLHCGTAEADPGCQVTVRYLVQCGRILPPTVVFAQLQLGVALIAADKRWVGLQLVAPEDDPRALADYRLHMRMVDYLTAHGRTAPAALHAGELALDYATPVDLSFHVAEAVRVAGARRIGHGTDLPHEDGAEALAAEMAAKGVLVEVNLTSNDAILGVKGRNHPYAWLRQRGVPVSLSTDDAGLLRIDLSHEYARAAQEGAGYADLKTSARNAIAFSFLSGEGLWADPGTYRRPAAACKAQIGEAQPRPGPCAELVAKSDKAREQWRHERLLKTFETGR